MFFGKPTQVKFYDRDNHEWHAGIAYHNEIICGCCGGIYEIDEVTKIIPFDTWVNIEPEIVGD